MIQRTHATNINPFYYIEVVRQLFSSIFKYKNFYPTDNTDQQKNTFFQNSLEIYTYSEAEWCPKHDVVFSFSLN